MFVRLETELVVEIPSDQCLLDVQSRGASSLNVTSIRPAWTREMTSSESGP